MSGENVPAPPPPSRDRGRQTYLGGGDRRDGHVLRDHSMGLGDVKRETPEESVISKGTQAETPSPPSLRHLRPSSVPSEPRTQARASPSDRATVALDLSKPTPDSPALPPPEAP